MNALTYQSSLGKLLQLTDSDIEPNSGVWGLRVPTNARGVESTKQTNWAIHDRFPTDLGLVHAWKICHETKTRHFSKVLPALLAALTLTLAACGGGGIDTTPPVTPPPVSSEASDVLPSCTDCGAVSHNTYAGTGVGIWHKQNTSAKTLDTVVSISGIVNKDVTVIVTNESGTDAVLPLSSVLPDLVPAGSQMPPVADGRTHSSVVEDFNREGWKSLLAAVRPHPSLEFQGSVAAPLLSVVGDTKSFMHQDKTMRATTLQRQAALPDGATVNFWVETAELKTTKVTASMLDSLMTTFAGKTGIYTMLTDVGGPLWGPHSYAGLIAGTDRPVIDIVLLNFNNDGKPFGEVGYFWPANNFKKTALATSNESLALFLDTETLYLGGGQGLQAIKLTMAHEGMHMDNFYRRGVLMGPTFAYGTWLEEMTAMMMEDVASNVIDPTYDDIRDVRYPNYLQNSSYGCALLAFTYPTPCDSYAVSGSFGGFMLRQMGVPFFKSLLTQASSDSPTALNAAISAARPGSGLGQELRKFSVAAISALPAAAAPTGFGFPRRTDGVYTMPLIDAQGYKHYRSLPLVPPASLPGYASYPTVSAKFTGVFRKVIRVPTGATVSVVVSDPL